MTESIKEDWKQIVLDGQKLPYYVSSLGRVYNVNTKRFLKGTYKSNEYHKVQLTINGKPTSFQVHRLVALIFCPNPNEYKIVDHINRNKWDNRVENLRWVTAKQNAANVKRAKKNKPARYYDGSLEDFRPMLTRDSKYLVSKDGMFINRSTKRIIEGGMRNGYVCIAVGGKSESAHCLVWEAFNGPIPKGSVIDYIDGNRLNNRLSNLRLVSQSENMVNAYRNGHKAAKTVVQYSKNGEYIERYTLLVKAAKAILGIR